MATTQARRGSLSKSSSDIPRVHESLQHIRPPTSPNTPLFRKKRFLNRKNRFFRVKRIGLSRLASSYFFTGYHTLIDLHWFLFMAILIIFYLSSFAFFGLVYYIISENWGCIEHVTNWPEAFFFSVQTGMTIGYGSMYPDGCRSIIYAVTIQSLFGLITDALVLGLAFEKLSRPEPASNAFLFTKNAVVCNRNGKRVLVCRVAWIKPTQVIEAHVRLYISNHHITEEGEKIFNFTELDLNETDSSFIFLALPHDIVHEINESSPLFGATKQDLYQSDVELVVVVEGISAFTSDTIQGHYSYLYSDIVWDKYLPTIVTQNADRSFTVDFTHFDDLVDSSLRIAQFNPEIN